MISTCSLLPSFQLSCPGDTSSRHSTSFRSLVAWVDEMLVDPAWEGGHWWTNHVLEWELFNTMDRFHLFYERAKDAYAAGFRNALEVYYVAVVLGFRGLYKEEPSSQLAAARELPENIEKWAAQMSMAIRMTPRPPIVSGGKPVAGAPPLTGQALLISSSMLAAAVGAVVVGSVIIASGL
ncbi:MAG: hypothetical protein B7Z73_10420 [Planctomycetia bacterium 21-64-5]|nr:MAG: hypothetical protein B7Z73_10420 [Planctomycetia bacterium 21-64-5]